MGIEDSMRVDTAVYWAPSTPDGYGQPTYATPVEITVRWEDDNQEFKDANGETRMTQAIVYTGQDVAVDGVLLQSTLSSSVDQTDPFANAGAWGIRRFNKLPFLRSTTRFLRTAYLA